MKKDFSSDNEVLNRLREPIEELVNQYCVNQPLINKIRLRQLPWQAVDILISTENIGALKRNLNFKRILDDCRQLGVSKEFIEKSIALAIKIYQTLKINYPQVYNRYKSYVKA